MGTTTPLSCGRENDVSLCCKRSEDLDYMTEITAASTIDDAYCSNWQAPPIDMMDMILQHTKFKDRIRLITICKYWESFVKRRDIHVGKHEVPWLLLPQHSNNNNYLNFLSLSDANIYKLLLPRTQVQGASWVVLGSSKGWLIITENLGPDSHEIFLFNPISRAQHQLPSLKTIPLLYEYFMLLYVELGTQGCAALELYKQVTLSTSDIDSEDCLIAAIFIKKIMAVCRPGDKIWTIGYEVPDSIDSQLDEDQALEDVLFSASGVLYTLTVNQQADKNNKFTVTQSTINLGDHHVVELKIVHDDFSINYLPRLLESTTDDHVFLIHQMRQRGVGGEGEGNEDEDGEGEGNVDGDGDGDGQGNEDEDEDGDGEDNQDDELDDGEGNQDDERDDEDDNGGGGEILLDEDEDGEGNQDGGGEVEEDEEGDGEGNDGNDVGAGDEGEVNGNNPQIQSYWKGTSDFRIYKLDPKNNNFTETQCLGDQILFLAEVGSLSLPSSHHNQELERNCIIFATSTIINIGVGKSYYSHELGVFNLNGGRIEKSFPCIDLSVRSQLESLIERD